MCTHSSFIIVNKLQKYVYNNLFKSKRGKELKRAKHKTKTGQRKIDDDDDDDNIYDDEEEEEDRWK